MSDPMLCERPARPRRLGLMVTTLAALALPPATLHAQTDGTCVPVAQRAGREFGCFITAREELGRLAASPPLYWHLATYPSRAAAEAWYRSPAYQKVQRGDGRRRGLAVRGRAAAR